MKIKGFDEIRKKIKAGDYDLPATADGGKPTFQDILAQRVAEAELFQHDVMVAMNIKESPATIESVDRLITLAGIGAMGLDDHTHLFRVLEELEGMMTTRNWLNELVRDE